MTEAAATQTTFTRFSLSQRVEHTLLMISFTMLCLTGLPQRFLDAAWAQRLVSGMGGLDTVRKLPGLADVAA